MNQKNAIHQAKQACSHSEENMCGKENTSHRGLEKRNVLTCYKQKLWNIVGHASAKVLFKIDSVAMRSTLFSTSKRWEFHSFLSESVPCGCWYHHCRILGCKDADIASAVQITQNAVHGSVELVMPQRLPWADNSQIQLTHSGKDFNLAHKWVIALTRREQRNIASVDLRSWCIECGPGQLHWLIHIQGSLQTSRSSLSRFLKLAQASVKWFFGSSFQRIQHIAHCVSQNGFFPLRPGICY